MRIDPECEFCDEFSGGVRNGFRMRYGGSIGDRSILATQHLRVFPSLGQLVEGYLLIAPTKHFAAVGDLPSGALNDLADTVSRVKAALSKNYGPCVLFEHGVRATGSGGCGIYHAHVHAFPLTGASDPVDSLKSAFPYQRLQHMCEIAKESAQLPCYLLFQDADGALYLFDTGPLPSQYMRRLLAQALGSPDWDWRSTGMEARLQTTLERLSGEFESRAKTA
jgi:diadenosine tetraphosphate (Ap4A) HIT family hydrolase